MSRGIHAKVNFQILLAESRRDKNVRRRRQLPIKEITSYNIGASSTDNEHEARGSTHCSPSSRSVFGTVKRAFRRKSSSKNSEKRFASSPLSQECIKTVSFANRNIVHEAQPIRTDDEGFQEQEGDPFLQRSHDDYTNHHELWYSSNEIQAQRDAFRKDLAACRYQQQVSRKLPSSFSIAEEGYFGTKMHSIFQECVQLASSTKETQLAMEDDRVKVESMEELMVRHIGFLRQNYDASRGIEKMATKQLRRYRKYHVKSVLSSQEASLSNGSTAFLPDELVVSRLRKRSLQTSQCTAILARMLALVDQQEAQC